MASSRYERLQRRLKQIDDRVGQLAEMEMNATLVGAYGSRGELQPIKDELVREAEIILDQLFELLEMEHSDE